MILNKMIYLDHIMDETQILNYLLDHPRGSTIVKIGRDLKASPNTIRKYVKILLNKNKIYSRKLHQYKLYYVSGAELDTEQAFRNFYMGLLVWLKKYNDQAIIEITGELVKKMGQEISERFRIEIDSDKVEKAINEVANMGIPDINTIQEILEGFRQYINLYEEEMFIGGITNLPPQKKVIIRYANVKLLVDSTDYVYHLYFLLGYIEGLFNNNRIPIPIKIDVGEIHSADIIGDTYFDIIVDYSEIFRLWALNR